MFMLLSRGGKRGKLQPVWRFAVDGMIWRIVITAGDKVVGESRNPETRQVRFFCLDALSGSPFWKGRTFGEQWWMGIEAVCGEIIFFHKYATPSLPEHRSIIAVDAASAEVLWVNEQEKLESVREGTVITSHTTPFGVKCVCRDARSGIAVADVNERDAIAARSAEAGTPDVMLPLPLEADAEGAALFRALNRAHALTGEVEAIRYGGKYVFNYHERMDPGGGDDRMRSVLAIVDKRDRAILFEAASLTSAAVPELFLVWKTMLFYIHERATLTAINLA